MERRWEFDLGVSRKWFRSIPDKLEIKLDDECAICSAAEVLEGAGDDDDTITSALLRLMPVLVEDISEILL